MDLAMETRLCHYDDVTNHILFREAQHQLENLQREARGGGGGVMGATHDQARQLEEFADPTFPAERQFLDLARSLPGYGALVAREVVVETDLISNNINLHRGNIVTCRLEREKLVLVKAGVSLKALQFQYFPTTMLALTLAQISKNFGSRNTSETEGPCH